MNKLKLKIVHLTDVPKRPKLLLFRRFHDKMSTVCLSTDKECEVRLYGYFGKSITEDEKVQ